jgi:hypothetical protein
MATTNKQVTLLKRLIWLYLVLLLTEGAMRKWGPSNLATPLLIVRDPVVLLIYMIAASCQKFVFNGYVMGCFLLAVSTFCASLLTSANLAVTLIGLRCYFLHLPLIFVMEKTLEKEDIQRIGKFLLWFAIPETILCVIQLWSPQTHWSNLSVGGIVTVGMSGAEGKFRPSGTFSFTNGVAAFYPLALAALLGFLLMRQKLPWYLSIVSAVCIAVAIPVSISRTNALTCALVLLTAAGAVFYLPSAPKAIIRMVLFMGAAVFIASWLPRFDEEVQVFDSRWESSTGSDVNGFQSNIVTRFFTDLLPPMDLIADTPLLGVGVGMGTPMASAYMTGERQFNLGEGEWQRLIGEMGPVLGLAFILLRIGLCARLVSTAYRALLRENIWSALFAVEAFLLVLNAQWGNATTLGFAIFSAGLAVASSRMVTSTAPAKSRRRSSYKPRRFAWEADAPKPAATLTALEHNRE